MPLHLSNETILKDDETQNAILCWALEHITEVPDDVFSSHDKKYLSLKKMIKDAKTDEEIGYIIVTLKVNDKQNSIEVIDIDLMIGDQRIEDLEVFEYVCTKGESTDYFNGKLDESVFMFETVNSLVSDKIDTEDIISGRICAFPFKLTTYNSEEEFNKKYSFKDVPNSEELVINGPLRLSRKFTMPSMEEDETFTMFIGTVKTIRHVDMKFGDIIVPFKYVVADTGMGMLPMAVNEDIEIDDDQLIEAYADIKIDLHKEA